MNRGVEKRQKDLYNAVQYMLSDSRGRHFLTFAIQQCGLYADAYRGCVNGALVNEGRRQVGLWLREVAAQHNTRMLGQMQVEEEEREAYYASLDMVEEPIDE